MRTEDITRYLNSTEVERFVWEINATHNEIWNLNFGINNPRRGIDLKKFNGDNKKIWIPMRDKAVAKLDSLRQEFAIRFPNHNLITNLISADGLNRSAFESK